MIIITIISITIFMFIIPMRSEAPTPTRAPDYYFRNM